MVALTKTDLFPPGEKVRIPYFGNRVEATAISAVSGKGIAGLTYQLGAILEQTKRESA
jgi:hypothetical protein